MIAAARNKEFDVILVHKFDRFARNDYDFVIYEKELEDLGIVLESVSEPGDASTPAGYIGRRMMQVISSWYSKNLAVEVKKGMQRMVETGGWPKKAPLGYVNCHDKSSAWIEVDPERGPFITEAFKEFATGKWTLEEWADHAFSLGWRSRKGNRIAKQAWSSIFHHRCYLGETWLKAGDISIKGNHSSLVDEDTFTQVQEVLRSHDKHKQRTQRHKYLLRGLVYSVEANSPCWSETHQRKGISYYRSRLKGNQAHVFYNTRVVEEQLPDIFRDITISEDTRQLMRQGLADWFNSETDTCEELQTAESRLVKLRTMEKNLQQLYLEEDISHRDFREHRARIEAERSRLTNTVAVVKQRQNLVKADFEIALQLATELDFLYDKGNFDERRLLCETVLKRLYVEEGIVKKVEFNSPFALIASRAKSSESVINGGR